VYYRERAERMERQRERQGLLRVYWVLLRVCRVLLYVYRCLLHVYRALLRLPCTILTTHLLFGVDQGYFRQFSGYISAFPRSIGLLSAMFEFLTTQLLSGALQGSHLRRFCGYTSSWLFPTIGALNRENLEPQHKQNTDNTWANQH